MNAWPVDLLVGVTVFLLCVAATPTSSSGRGDSARAAVHVGPRSVAVGELQARLELVPSIQKRALGATDDERRARFVNEVVVPESLFALEAERTRLSEQPAVRARLNGVLRDALMLDLGQQLARERAVTQIEVERYFAEHRAEFSVPKRLRAWWIVVDSSELAQRILSETRGVAGVKRWTELARQHSTDRATRMRSGDLGFINASGQSSVPNVRVSPEVYAAADGVVDGAIVPKPVEVSGRFAVIWRRGSSPARTVELEDVQPRIERALMERLVAQRLDATLETLRKQHVRDVRAGLVMELPRSSAPATPER
jgi:hypothetical protein